MNITKIEYGDTGCILIKDGVASTVGFEDDALAEQALKTFQSEIAKLKVSGVPTFRNYHGHRFIVDGNTFTVTGCNGNRVEISTKPRLLPMWQLDVITDKLLEAVGGKTAYVLSTGVRSGCRVLSVVIDPPALNLKTEGRSDTGGRGERTKWAGRLGSDSYTTFCRNVGFRPGIAWSYEYGVGLVTSGVFEADEVLYIDPISPVIVLKK